MNKKQNKDIEDVVEEFTDIEFLSGVPVELPEKWKEKLRQALTAQYERGKLNAVDYIEAVAEEMGQDIAEETVWKEVLYQARNL